MSHDHSYSARSPKIRIEALEDLLVEKGLVDRSRIDNLIQKFETDVGPMIGAQLVARAWTDPEFRNRLLDDADDVLSKENISGAEIEHVEVKANEPGVHNVVVCTLCSCYPWAVLGLPPKWYKDPAYRSRIVREPRKVLDEMGLTLPSDTEIKVWDSSAEVRYMVLPEQPAGTENMTESELANRVSRDAMIGVAHA